MLKKTHMNIGLACIIPILTWHNIYVLPIAILGAIMPDFDRKIGLRHRGASHSILVAVIISFIFSYIFNEPIGEALFIGYISHILADSITSMGVPMFWPLYRKNVGLRFFNTGSPVEHSINFIVYLIILWLLLLKLKIFEYIDMF